MNAYTVSVAKIHSTRLVHVAENVPLAIAVKTARALVKKLTDKRGVGFTLAYVNSLDTLLSLTDADFYAVCDTLTLGVFPDNALITIKRIE